MMQLPARYDHVGSFLRPKYLLEAREKKAMGEITPAQLTSFFNEKQKKYSGKYALNSSD